MLSAPVVKAKMGKKGKSSWKGWVSFCVRVFSWVVVVVVVVNSGMAES